MIILQIVTIRISDKKAIIQSIVYLMIVYEGEKDMKKEYVRPVIVGERFAPNEYIAACGDSGKVYKFECNAGSKHNF